MNKTNVRKHIRTSNKGKKSVVRNHQRKSMKQDMEQGFGSFIGIVDVELKYPNKFRKNNSVIITLVDKNNVSVTFDKPITGFSIPVEMLVSSHVISNSVHYRFKKPLNLSWINLGGGFQISAKETKGPRSIFG